MNSSSILLPIINKTFYTSQAREERKPSSLVAIRAGSCHRGERLDGPPTSCDSFNYLKPSEFRELKLSMEVPEFWGMQPRCDKV